MVLAAIRAIFAQPDATSCRAQLDEVVGKVRPRFPTVAAMLADARDDLLAFSAFPVAHWKRIWSTNPLERVNKEIERRTDVVGTFPGETAVLRLAGAIVIELHDEWEVSERRYLSEGSMALLDGDPDDGSAEEVDAGKTLPLAS